MTLPASNGRSFKSGSEQWYGKPATVAGESLALSGIGARVKPMNIAPEVAAMDAPKPPAWSRTTSKPKIVALRCPSVRNMAYLQRCLNR
jgi:hypothetical protein